LLRAKELLAQYELRIWAQRDPRILSPSSLQRSRSAGVGADIGTTINPIASAAFFADPRIKSWPGPVDCNTATRCAAGNEQMEKHQLASWLWQHSAASSRGRLPVLPATSAAGRTLLRDRACASSLCEAEVELRHFRQPKLQSPNFKNLVEVRNGELTLRPRYPTSAPPESGLKSDIGPCPFGAKLGNRHIHSINVVGAQQQ
jgi:hypothetical protein